MSNKNFLHTIVAPNLTDSNFGQSIQTQFDNINTNFQRLVSAAYLSGQDGNDVVVKDVPIYTENITVLDRTTNEIKVYDTIAVINEFLNVGDVNYDFVIADGQENKYEFLYDILQQAVFTDFGLQLVETIFGEQFELTYHRLISIVNNVETVHSELGYVLINEDLEYRYPSYSDTKKYPVWLAFVYSPFVRMFAIHDIDTDTITNICATQLYYFYDARIGSIQLLDDKYSANDFTDYTSFITISSERNADGDYEINGTYTMSKSQDLPTLYYDNDAQEFCWKMNGIETNITAQGVKGDKGEPAGCWFCRGVATTIQENADPMISVRLTTYYTTDDTGTIILRSVNDENCEIKNGDFVCVDVYNSDATNNTTYFDTIFGNVKVDTQITGDSSYLEYNVTRPYYTSILSMMNNSPTLLYKQLENIRNDSDDDKLHGLYIPIDIHNALAEGMPPYFVHAMFSETNSNDLNPPTTLHLLPCEKNYLYGKGVTPSNGIKNELILTGESNQYGMPIFKHLLRLWYNLSLRGELYVGGNVDMQSGLYVEGKTELNDELKAKNIIARGEITSKVNGADNVKVGVPIGTVVDYYNSRIPDGWMKIDDSDDGRWSENDEGYVPIQINLHTALPTNNTDGTVKMKINNLDVGTNELISSFYISFPDTKYFELFKYITVNEEYNVENGIVVVDRYLSVYNLSENEIRRIINWQFYLDISSRSETASSTKYSITLKLHQ